MSLLDQANKAALDAVKKDTPSQFTVGVFTDGRKVTSAVTYNRNWKTGWGLTAYAKAWWNDAAVIPDAQKSGVAVGAELSKKF